jgi:hypothetical protein
MEQLGIVRAGQNEVSVLSLGVISLRYRETAVAFIAAISETCLETMAPSIE